MLKKKGQPKHLGSGSYQIMENYFLGMSCLEEDSAAESLVFQNYDKNRQKKAGSAETVYCRLL